MSVINATGMHFRELNDTIRAGTAAGSDIHIENCNGQRYIGSGLGSCKIEIEGTPGNALGAYLNGAQITVHGNAQDATGDTMNSGMIAIHGSTGDATGYAMRGGSIFIQGDVGYRAGIHMKAYDDKLPVLVIGGQAGSFLGEYQAGGIILVLGIGKQREVPVGHFCGTGMHGGKIYLQCECKPQDLPEQVEVEKAEIGELEPYIDCYCELFQVDGDELKRKEYYVLSPNTRNPYKQLYTHV